MRQFKYNAMFFGQWMEEHPEVNKRDILNVLETKDYASLRRWAEGSEMPTKSIIKLCNAYGIDIENFFIGMIKPTDTDSGITNKNIVQEDNSNDFPIINENTHLSPSKRLQLESRHSKDIFLREKQHQQALDNLRTEYDTRLDEQRRDMMQTIDKQCDHIAHQAEIIDKLSQILTSRGNSGNAHKSLLYGVSDGISDINGI